MGYRGYISSREFFHERAPQHVQNLVIRNYCNQNGMELLLSATEVIMPNSYLMLEQLLNELSELDGIVCYSLFQLPINPIKRKQVFNTILDSDKSIHFAVEALSAAEASDVNRLEDIFLVRNALGAALEPEDLRQILLNQGLTNQDG